MMPPMISAAGRMMPSKLPALEPPPGASQFAAMTAVLELMFFGSATQFVPAQASSIEVYRMSGLLSVGNVSR